MKRILTLIAVLSLLASCGTDKKTNHTETMNTNEALQEVAGRKNFGPNHALVTTPQPCVMIATWDENKNPDVMMAAWAGQYDARQIVIQPWERNMLPIIEKAILAANLGFTPQNNGEFIRIVVPSLTEERRKELVKKVKQETEQNKVTIRNIRRTANDTAKKLKDGGVPEDEAKKLEADIQKMTDDFIAKIDKMAEAKEKEIMTV